MNTIRPDGMSPIEWCDRTSATLAAFVPVVKIDREDQWPSWGEHVTNVLRHSGVIIPNPRQFPDFEEWATRFNQAIANLE